MILSQDQYPDVGWNPAYASSALWVTDYWLVVPWAHESSRPRLFTIPPLHQVSCRITYFCIDCPSFVMFTQDIVTDGADSTNAETNTGISTKIGKDKRPRLTPAAMSTHYSTCVHVHGSAAPYCWDCAEEGHVGEFYDNPGGNSLRHCNDQVRKQAEPLSWDGSTLGKSLSCPEWYPPESGIEARYSGELPILLYQVSNFVNALLCTCDHWGRYCLLFSQWRDHCEFDSLCCSQHW